MKNFINSQIIKNTGIINIDRPQSLNALNIKMIEEIKNSLAKWKSNYDIKKIIIKSKNKSFCAGGDIKAISLEDKNSILRKNFFKSEYELNYIIKSFPKPIISIWNGIVMGGGVGISIYGKYRVTTEKTRFAMPESAIGFFPDVGSSYVLSRLDNSIGLYIGLTGILLNSYEIYNLNLANYFIYEKNINKFIEDFIIKDSLPKKFFDDPPFNESEIFNNLKLIKKHFSSFDIENIFHSLKSDQSIFANKTLQHLLNRCPASLAITCGIFKRALYLNSKYSRSLNVNTYYKEMIDRTLLI